MMLTTPGTWADALAWFVAHLGERLEVKLASGGLGIDSVTRFDEVEERHGAFGVVLAGQRWWIAEEAVRSVFIDPKTEAIILLVDTDSCLYLCPFA